MQELVVSVVELCLQQHVLEPLYDRLGESYLFSVKIARCCMGMRAL